MRAIPDCSRPGTYACRIGEKMLDWVDEPLEPQTILEFVTLYWLTETIPRAIYFYREVRVARSKTALDTY